MRDPLPIKPLIRPPDAVVALPGSKSLTNRALVASALAEGTTRLDEVLLADDTWAMVEGLRALGIDCRVDEGLRAITVDGCGGELPAIEATVDARQSGTTARFLTAVAALSPAPVTIDGDDQLRARPMEDQIAAMRAIGVSVEELGAAGRLPIRVSGPPAGRSIAIAGDVSSQFASGMLLAGATTGVDVRLTSTAVSRPYLDMTTAVLRAFGAEVSDDDGTSWTVGGGYHSPGVYEIEPDASAASYFLAAAAITGGRVRIERLGRASVQGDVAFVDVLADMGAEVDAGPDHLQVAGGSLHGVEVDLRHISDTAPTLAVVAAFAHGQTTVGGIGFIRGKESDRVGAPVAELRRAGIDAEETTDGFVVRPSGPPQPAVFETYDDHRMAMAFALVGLVVDGVAVRGPGCVAKTFPGFFDALDQLR